MDKNKLLGVIASAGETCSDAANVIGVTRVTFSKKINEKDGASFTQPEILAIKNHYNLNAEQVDLIFFAPKVS